MSLFMNLSAIHEIVLAHVSVKLAPPGFLLTIFGFFFTIGNISLGTITVSIISFDNFPLVTVFSDIITFFGGRHR